jgi:ribonucleoside-diphosphate reductase beta chain
MADDVKDWQKNLTDSEQNLVTQIFRFFTQADVEVNNCYMKHYSQVFKPTEVLMMLSAFSNIETIHIAAYSHLLDTIGMPEMEYTAFLKYKEMKDKYDYMQNFSVDNKTEIAKTLAAFGAFTEGLQLFASFAILHELPALQQDEGHGPDRDLVGARRDAALPLRHPPVPHLRAGESGDLERGAAPRPLRDICSTIVDHEDAFIDLAFEMGSVRA